MKIYFEDGRIRNLSQLAIQPDYVVDAKDGVNANIDALDDILYRDSNATVYTNSIFAFSNVYAWNKELGVPEIYIRARETSQFTRIDELTKRELRESHKLGNMFIAGEFDK